MSISPLVKFAAAAATTLCLASPAFAAGSSIATINATSCEAPHFPARWQNDGDGASVVVAYLVTAEGKVVDSKIDKSSGLSYIDRASERAGARCKFVPAEGSAAAATWTKVKYSWVVN
jgi:protein TonB